MNAVTEISSASARAITRRLPAPVDLLALYAKLSENGRRPDTSMFETTAGRSIIVERAAVRITCRGAEVVLDALSSSGRPVLEVVQRALVDRVLSFNGDRLVLRFDRSDATDSEKRLMAPSPYDALRAILNGFHSETPEEPMTVCLVGVIAFDQVDLFEDLPSNPEDQANFADFVFWLAESSIISEPGLTPRLVCTSFGLDDDEQRRSHNSAIERLRDLSFQSSDVRSVRVTSGDQVDICVDHDDQDFASMVLQLKEHIIAGDVYQIVASRTFSAACPDPLSSFARVRALDRSPYMFFVSMHDCLLFGASPETSVRVTREGGKPIVEVKPIAGTRPRGNDPDEDDRLETDLRLDAKDSAEHMMLVDLARNDVARVSEPGTRHLAQLMALEKYARVMHLVSSVKGVLSSKYDLLHVLQACLNPGTLSGAPKLKATELLRHYEPTRRGPYGGTLGWLSGEGSMDTAIVIRSALVKDGTAFVRAGAGIVFDSDPIAEADETRRKASALLSAIAGEKGK
jgi:anthranilate synthase component I